MSKPGFFCDSDTDAGKPQSKHLILPNSSTRPPSVFPTLCPGYSQTERKFGYAELLLDPWKKKKKEKKKPLLYAGKKLQQPPPALEDRVVYCARAVPTPSSRCVHAPALTFWKLE